MGEQESDRSTPRALTVPQPFGARVVVDPITPIDEITVRAKEAGLTIVVAERNRPKPTLGSVVAVGNDPFVQENFRIGEVVMFSRFAGTEANVEGHTFLVLDAHEVICKVPPTSVAPRATPSGAGG